LTKIRWAVAAAAVIAASAEAGFEDDYEVKRWEEIAVQLPAAPKIAECIPFFVSSASSNRFCVDPGSISVGSDGVVRYVLVVETPSGVRNVSFEGMRCEARERRLYAFGQPDGSWSKSRSNQWERIREAAANRHHAALFQDHFCPNGVIVRTADEARDALRRGEHPSLKRY